MASDCSSKRALSPTYEEPPELESFDWRSIDPSLQPGTAYFDPLNPPPLSLHGRAFYDNVPFPKTCLTPDALREVDRQYWEHDNSTRAHHQPSRNSGLPSPTNTAAGEDVVDSELSASSCDESCIEMASKGRPKKGSQASTSRVTGTSSPYDASFESRLLDANIISPRYKDSNGNKIKAAVDADVIKARLMQGRDDLGDVTEHTFNQICNLSFESKRKAITLENLYGILAPKPKGSADTKVVFNNLAALTPTNQSLTSAQPDYYIGASVHDINKELRKDLEDYIQPSQDLLHPLAPNLFLEVKGTGSSDQVAMRQATHCGALGARAIRKLESYRNRHTPFDRKIKAISCTFIRGTLTFYGSHFEPNGPAGELSTITHFLWETSLRVDLESCKAGIAGFRNAMDLAADIRNAAITGATDRLRRREASDGSTSTDELQRD